MKTAKIADIPSNWAITPVKNKIPYRDRWQHENPVSYEFICNEMDTGKATGYGLRTGNISGGVLAIDFDGESAQELYRIIFGLEPPKDSVSWTSGIELRYQILYSVPDQYRTQFEDLTSHKLREYKDFKCAEKEQIEFRFNRSQSVLPPSSHPETGQYQWINSPQDTQIAQLPQFIIDFLLPIIAPQKSMNTNNCYEKYLSELTLPLDEKVPLIKCIAPISRNLLDGVNQGRRHDTGASLARDLIGTANYLSSIGQSFDGDPYELLSDFCSNCSPQVPKKECDRIFKSAEKSTPKPCMDEEKINNCIKAWYWKNSDIKKQYISTGKIGNEQRLARKKIEAKITRFEAIEEARKILTSDHDEITTSILLDEIRLKAGFSESFWEKSIIRVLRSEVKETKLKLEIAYYSQETDIFRQVQLKQKICSTYSLNNLSFQQLVDHVEALQNTPEKTHFTFTELMQFETTAENWLIPSFLPMGEMLLLTALPKVGKTLLANDVAYAVLSGTEVLGEKATKGKVLYVGSDETKASLIRRLQSRGFDLLPEAIENLEIETHLDLSNLTSLEAHLNRFKPDLLIIDSLTSTTINLNISENDAEFAKYIYRVKDLLKKYNTASILIHHENKSNDAKGISKVSGSARIPAAVWGIAQLSGTDSIGDGDDNELVKGQNIRWLDLKPREGEKIKYILEINPKATWCEKGIFTFKGDCDDPNNQKRSQGELVVKLLNDTGERLEYSQINEKLNIGKDLYKVLDRLCDRQLINRARSKCNPRRWVWFINNLCQEENKNNKTTSNANCPTPPPLTVSPSFVDLKTESIDNKEFEVSGQVSGQVSRQTNVLMDKVDTSNEDSEVVLGLVDTLVDTGGGGGCRQNVSSKNNDFSYCENPSFVENNVTSEPSGIGQKWDYRKIDGTITSLEIKHLKEDGTVFAVELLTGQIFAVNQHSQDWVGICEESA